MADGVVFGSRTAPCCAWQVDDFCRLRDVGRWHSSSTSRRCGRRQRVHPSALIVCSVDATPVERLWWCSSTGWRSSAAVTAANGSHWRHSRLRLEPWYRGSGWDRWGWLGRHRACKNSKVKLVKRIARARSPQIVDCVLQVQLLVLLDMSLMFDRVPYGTHTHTAFFTVDQRCAACARMYFAQSLD